MKKLDKDTMWIVENWASEFRTDLIKVMEKHKIKAVGMAANIPIGKGKKKKIKINFNKGGRQNGNTRRDK